MNILYYFYNKFFNFLFINRKKLSIFIPFIAGIVFALCYVWHIHNYYFVFPHSALLFVLSSLSFLTSILIVLTYEDSRTFRRIVKGILLICLMIFIGYILSELKILEHKVLRFRLIKILTLLLLLINTIAILFENKVISESYKYVVENKLEVLMYFICLIPFFLYVGILYPGAANGDTLFMFQQASSILAINNWNPVIIVFILKLSSALHLKALTLLYVINTLSILYSAIILSRLVKKYKMKYILLVLVYIFPIIMHHFYLPPKGSLTTFLIMCAVSTLVYSLFNTISYHFYLGIAFLIVVSLIRHNQITQTFILLIPFIILYTYYKNTSIKSSMKIIILFLIIILGLNKTILNNKNIINQIDPASWVYSSDILYILLDNKKTCKEYQLLDNTTNCKKYDQLVTNFDKQTTSNSMAKYIYIHFAKPFQVRDMRLWLKYILNYPGSWLEFHYTATLQNFLYSNHYTNNLKYSSDEGLRTKWRIQTGVKNKYNYSLGDVKLKKDSKIDVFINKLAINILFKYKLYLMVLILITTFTINKFKFTPIAMDGIVKYSCISYYLSLSCITLFIPLVLLVPTGWESRYLAGVDFTLIVSIVMLFIYLYKKYTMMNNHMEVS